MRRRRGGGGRSERRHADFVHSLRGFVFGDQRVGLFEQRLVVTQGGYERQVEVSTLFSQQLDVQHGGVHRRNDRGLLLRRRACRRDHGVCG